MRKFFETGFGGSTFLLSGFLVILPHPLYLPSQRHDVQRGAPALTYVFLLAARENELPSERLANARISARKDNSILKY